jgi:CheY-like chemotaxis protein
MYPDCDDTQSPTRVADRGTSAPHPRPAALCVLVVDDDASVRTVLRHIVEGLGYRCEEANGGLCALACLGAHAIDIVLTDHEMPGCDGMTLLGTLERRRLADGRALPAILVTSSGSRPTEAQARTAGAVALVRKPIHADHVRAALAAAAAAAVHAGTSPA